MSQEGRLTRRASTLLVSINYRLLFQRCSPNAYELLFLDVVIHRNKKLFPDVRKTGKREIDEGQNVQMRVKRNAYGRE